MRASATEKRVRTRYYIEVKFSTALVALFVIPAAFAQTTSMPLAPAPGAAQTPAPASKASAGAPPSLVDPNHVVLTIGEIKLTAADYEHLVAALPQQYQAYAKGPGRRAFAENLVQMKLLSNEAVKENLDKQPQVQDQLKFQREDLLARTMFLHYQDTAKVDDAAVQQYYESHTRDFESVKASHILIRVKGAPMPAAAGKTELTDEEALAKAQAIRKRVTGGEDFATVAKAESDDTGSAQNGGSLGEFHRGQMVPPFEQAAFSMKPGDISEPVKTPFGYHIIKVEAHNTRPLAEVKAEIEKKLRPEIARKQLETLRSSTTVQFDDAYFGPAPAAPATPATLTK
jgi:peptidyl-prolyl cis-trans isomerase C